MQFNVRALVLALVLGMFVTACGGGGGSGGSPAPVAPPAVAITESNAKQVAASAIEAVQNTSAVQGGADLVLGVDVQANGARAPSTFVAMAELARFAAAAAPAAALSVGVTISATESCELGGTISVNGNVASDAGLAAGDNITIQASHCAMLVDGVLATMNGAMSMSVVSGSATAIPFHVVLAVTASNLSVASAASTVVASGDVRLDMTAFSLSSESIVAAGTAMTSRITIGAASRTATMRNYSHHITANGTAVTSTLTASVETSSTALGANGGSYAVTTPVAMAWDALTLTVSAGAIKVVGAAGSQLLITVVGSNNVAIQVDANGDSVYEKNVASTIAELRALL